MIVSKYRQRPERSAVLFRTQSKDAIPNEILSGNRPLRLRPAILRLHCVPLRTQGSAQGAGFSIVMD